MRQLETSRLKLRDWKISDVDDAFAFWSNPNVVIPEGSTPIKTPAECKAIQNGMMSHITY